MVGARAHLSDDGQVHRCGVPIAVTAFRRGDHWAWWTLLVSSTVALVSAMRYDWMVNAIGPFELTEYFGLALVYGALRDHSSFPRRWAATSTDGLTLKGWVQ